MKFKDVYEIVGSLPCTEEQECQCLFDWILEHKPKNALELGFFLGKTSCVIAAALQEIGDGRLMSIDLEEVRKFQNQPNICENLKKTNLEKFVDVIFSKVSYTWELKNIIEDKTHDGRCAEMFDFVFLDGSHLWETDVCAFFLLMKLLRPGGWILFDDYTWSIATSDWWHQAPEMERYPDAYRKESHVKKIIELVVSQHPDIETVIIRNNWVWARKRTTVNQRAIPSIITFSKQELKLWIRNRMRVFRKINSYHRGA